MNELGIDLFNGTNIYQTTCRLSDDNFFHIYNLEKINYNLGPNQDFFQTKEITNFLYNYLHKKKLNIIEKNQFNERYNNNNDLFIHIRLDDASRFNPGINYYLNTIKNINFDNLYISTDEENHDIIKTIIDIYPTAILINYDEIKTFKFASTCKNIILSHGSFSAVIGYLSFFSKIYYPEYECGKMWYGDMFSIINWIKCKVN